VQSLDLIGPADHHLGRWVAHLLHILARMPLTPAVRQRYRDLRGALRRASERHPYTVVAVLSAFFIGAVLPVACGLWLLASLRGGLPDREAVRRIGEMDQATTVYDASDRPAFTIFRQQRIEVPLSGMSPNIKNAILAIEDQRFYAHHGFDAHRIVAATLANIRHLRAAQGASTITQQLARQSFLTPEKTLHRKAQEAILSWRIEHMYSKPQILELYLNKVYFGDGLYGVEAASRGYFGKHASEVTVAEAATLAGLVKSPSSYAPTTSLARATARRNVVLQAMLEAGVIDQTTAGRARATTITLSNALRPSEHRGEYFEEQVRRELVDRFGWQRVYQRGMRVYTTIDMAMQESAEAVVQESLQSLDERRRSLPARRRPAGQVPPAYDDSKPLQSAMVVLDPGTGQVRAMIGGRNFDESTFNRAVQARRQPGSAFKPFVYAAALESGYTPATVLDHLDDPILTRQGEWTPEDEHSTESAMSLRTGLRMSSNRAAVGLLQRIGIPRTVEFARNMGVGDVPSVPSLALGSGEVTLHAMTAAYAAFANGGRVPKPILIRRVEDQDGRVLWAEEPSSRRAISETTAFLMSTMLADVVNAGTAAGARRLGFTLPAAGKTGTTNDFNDAWFIGYTPRLVAGVWVGFDQPHTIMPRGFAAEVAVPIWAKFMKQATRGDPPQWFSTPPGIRVARVCRLSGKLATDVCQNVEAIGADGQVSRQSMVYNEYFVAGTEPTGYCEAHAATGIIGKAASLFAARAERPAPPKLDDTLRATPTRPAIGEKAVGLPADQPEAQPEKKHGFWFRMFHGRSHDSNQSAPNGRVEDPRKSKGQ
jgi:1A family penicillin-binding protein